MKRLVLVFLLLTFGLTIVTAAQPEAQLQTYEYDHNMLCPFIYGFC